MIARKKLGSTEIEMSTLGLGTVKFGRNSDLKYTENFNLPEKKELVALLQCAKDAGVNLLDTAPAYGVSEERLGELLHKDRHSWIISTKVGEEYTWNPATGQGTSHFDFSAKHTRFSVERSLKRLGTDYLDLVLIHSNGDDEKILQETDCIPTLEKLKQEGWIRAFGMSTKTLAGSLAAIDACDAVMLVYNLEYRDEEAAMEKAAALNKGILLKKVLASGRIRSSAQDPIANPIEEVFDLVYAQKGVTSAIIGTINLQHLRTNLATALSSQQRLT
jgi:aryl-alcohol dehydrogenase-like predicted oxidoreductase